ncbi:MAG TPA: hypothetical protein VGL22_13135 [Terracidiphilus sp.]
MAVIARRIGRPSSKWTRKALYIAVGLCGAAAVPLAAGLYSSASRGLNPLTAWACTSEKRGSLSNVSGWDLEIEHTTCDLFSRQEAVTVYASRREAGASGRRWFRSRAMVFRYVPGSSDDLLPSFESTGPDRILITVPSVASVAVQKYALEQTAVNYHIGHIEYPDPARLGQAH